MIKNNEPIYKVNEMVVFNRARYFVININGKYVSNAHIVGKVYTYDLGCRANGKVALKNVREYNLSKPCGENTGHNDNVNHPNHYTDGSIEVIDYIEDKHLSYHLGNAIKYISRAGKKNVDKYVEDLEKAVWYINREIERFKALK